VLDVRSEDGTREAARAFAEQDPHVRVLHINRKVSATLAFKIGVSQARGSLVFFLNPSDKISIQSLERYEAEGIEDDQLLVIGRWLFEDEDFQILRSTLNRFLEFATEKVLSLANLRFSCGHARTFLFTRSAATILWSKMELNVDGYDLQLMIIAANSRIRVRVAELEQRNPARYSTPSLTRLGHLATAVHSLLVHRFHIRDLKFMAMLAQQTGWSRLSKLTETEPELPM
jgi:glycosyltransferase involved in cell wall biosynthesis